jgi:hypothetical protein
MFLFNNIQLKPDRIISYLQDFEAFCLGEKRLSPEEFKNLNIELSINAVLHIGKHKFKRCEDGRHLIWTGPDHREHDLGSIDQMNVMRDYPGFNKVRSLALDHGDVEETKVINVPLSRRQLTLVKMKDGSTGIGPDYKTALRNAALKKKLKKHFNGRSGEDLWKRFHGSA